MPDGKEPAAAIDRGFIVEVSAPMCGAARHGWEVETPRLWLGPRATLARVPARDLVLAAVLIFGFASFVTVHVWLSVRLLLAGKPRTRGLVALFVPPLAPIWGYKQGFRRGAVLWVATLVLYVVARVVAEF